MSAYFSRLAQRCGGSGQGARRTAPAARIDASPAAAEVGYDEQQHFVDAPPAAVSAPPGAQRDSAVATTPQAAIDAPASTSAPAAASRAAAIEPSPLDSAAVDRIDPYRIDPYRIDPYRNDPDDDAQAGIATGDVGFDVVASVPAATAFPEGIPASAAASTPPQRAATQGDRDADVESFVEAGRRDPTPSASAARAASPHAAQAQSPTVARRSLRAGSASADRPIAADPVRREPAEDAVFAVDARDRVRADADAQAAQRPGSAAVRAQSPQTPAPEPAPAHRVGQGLHVHIGRVELEVIAPPPKAAHPPVPAPAPAPAPAPPARDSAFNPHRHYLRGR